MQGIHLKFYTYENTQHQGILLYEWLLEQAKKLGISGGSVFRAIAGFGRHGVIHEEHFFEMASNTPVETLFVVSQAQYDQFMDLITREKLNIFYVKMAVEHGVVGE